MYMLSKIKELFQLKAKLENWGTVEEITSDRTESFQTKSLLWGGIWLLINYTNAKATKILVLEFEPALSTLSLKVIVGLLFFYYFSRWVKSIYGDVLRLQTAEASLPLTELSNRLKVTLGNLREAREGVYFGLFAEQAEKLRSAVDSVAVKEKETVNRCIIRNVLFWLEVAFPPLVLIANLVVIFWGIKHG